MSEKTQEEWEAEAEEMRRQAEIEDLREEILRLRRRCDDLEAFLRGAAIQFNGMAGTRDSGW
jgi:polyhydroxyalkanoate synthesis regulator phasin